MKYLAIGVLPAAVAAMLFIVNGNQLSANEELLWRSATFWGEYQDISLTGTAKRYAAGDLQEEHAFTFNISHAAPGELPPWEVRCEILNPGEPHLESATVVDTACAFDGKIYVNFQRQYVTDTPQYARLSSVGLSSARVIGPIGRHVRMSVSRGISEEDVTYNVGLKRDKLFSNATMEILGSGEYKGVAATEVRLSFKGYSPNGMTANPIVIDAWIATDPTFQVLDITNVAGGYEGQVDQEYRDSSTKFRIAESFQVMGEWLICNRAKYPTHDGYWLVEIDKAEELPNDYVGIWDYSKLTGVNFAGDAEKATRRGSNRLLYEHTRNATYVPHTEEEMSKIRRHLVHSATPVQPRTNWVSVLLWAVNGFAVAALAWWVSRRLYRRRVVLALFFTCWMGVSSFAGNSASSDSQAVALPNVPMVVKNDGGYCGIVAAEYVAKRLSRALVPGPHFSHLNNLPASAQDWWTPADFPRIPRGGHHVSRFTTHPAVIQRRI